MHAARDSSELSEAIDRLDIQSWLDRESLDYKVTRGSRGMQLNVRECPICGNSNWKVYLNQDSGLGNCFAGGCEEHFNKWKFIKSSLALNNREVVEHILAVAKDLGWRPIERTSAPVVMSAGPKLPASYELPIKGRNLAYLTKRGISIEASEYFKLRYCKEGYFEYEVEGRTVRQSYSSRIIIPLFGLDGRLVSFQGRDITGTAEKKYLFPPGYAASGQYLYNGHNAKHASHILIGEGAFDVFAQKAALDEAEDTRGIVPVGTFGKHLGEGQIQELLTLKDGGLRIITIMWDGERQAFEDAIDAALKLRGHGFVARVALLPAGCDPNEVKPAVVRQAFWEAKVIDAASAITMKLSRQYA